MSAALQAAALRQLADMLDEHPELCGDVDYMLRSSLLAMPLHNPEVTDQRQRLALWARAARRHGATATTKDVSDDTFEVVVAWGDALRIRVLASRDEVCERVVVGTEEVTRQVPDPEAPPAPLVEITETVEHVEWRCHPLLADDAVEATS